MITLEEELNKKLNENSKKIEEMTKRLKEIKSELDEAYDEQIAIYDDIHKNELYYNIETQRWETDKRIIVGCNNIVYVNGQYKGVIQRIGEDTATVPNGWISECCTVCIIQEPIYEKKQK